jgi:hypothetical protein
MSNAKWPENIPMRTATEWEQLGATWTEKDSREAIVAALKELKVPATEYARMQPTERAQRIAQIQEERVPGSTTGAKKTAAAPAGAKKAAAPAAAAGAKTTTTASTGGGGGSVDLGPVIAKLAEMDAKLDSLAVTSTNVETLLKLILLNPSMADSLQLAADADVLAEFAGKSIGELASGNG